ncbi:LOW QUALITY PROTEIN: hypothetical protein TorRG33x02_000030 [Trema orientale]|uniref:Uncharacterized protein n=1 Tax=Trema orientale TaxID=63057 RepID=A0A2P5G107_TREOI|nr:LOW QUALITY PROTEIN: hypothetical protein TorRG33x02_000030 [Trema orientale]
MNPFNEFQPNVVFAMQLDIVELSRANDSTKKKENKNKRRNNGEENTSSSKDKKPHSHEKRYPGTPKFTYYIEHTNSRENMLIATEDHISYRRKAKERGGTTDSTGISVIIQMTVTI